MTMKERMAMPNISENTKVTISLYMMAILLVSVIGMAFSMGAYKQSIDDKVLRSCHDIEVLMRRADGHDDELNSQKIQLTRIETDVQWIRTTLEDMKDE